MSGASARRVDSSDELARAAAEWRARGARVVAVQGLGFVGTAVSAAFAAARGPEGAPRFLVLGVERADASGAARAAAIAAGRCPVRAPDPALDATIELAVRETGNLLTCAEPGPLALADAIVVDVPLDVEDGAPQTGPFVEALRDVGRHMREDALVLVETTVPVGACERWVRPALEEERAARGIRAPLRLAHAYERVTPGPRYLDSVRRFWRTLAADDAESRAAARELLDGVIDTEHFPLRELDCTRASELGKLLENAYRAVNIAFIHEWTRLAEAAGVDLWAVVESIRVRRGTHDNMRNPGFGVGGYCLPKDPLLADWSAREWWPGAVPLELSMHALRINAEMPLHTLAHVEALCPELQRAAVLVCGASYLPDVDDTRGSPTGRLADALRERGTRVLVHDPVVECWRGQPDLEVRRDLAGCLAECDGAVFAVAHSAYRALGVDDFRALRGDRCFVVDATNSIPDALAEELAARGVRVSGVGKGHWRRRGLHTGAR